MPDEAHNELIDALHEALAALAHPAEAAAMQAYMKSAMPFYGIHAPALRQIYRRLFVAYPLSSFAEWQATVLALWRTARFREERYAAIALTGERRYQPFQRLDALPLYEELIVTGAWWDFVDEVAIHRVGGLLRQHPETMAHTMSVWSSDKDAWKRRTAIICQNSFKAITDEQLLYACIEPNLADKDFFIRKAIGWALREYAKTRPAAVVAYVQAHEASLSGLSRREALKHVGTLA